MGKFWTAEVREASVDCVEDETIVTEMRIVIIELVSVLLYVDAGACFVNWVRATWDVSLTNSLG